MGILSIAVRFFQEEEWAFNELEEGSTLHAGIQGDNGHWDCFVQAREEQEQLVFYSVCPVAAPEGRRPAMAEYLTRANYGMAIGNFEMDWNDGEIRYKTSIDVEGDRLSVALVGQLVYANVLAMDRYLPGIVAVIESQASPAEAIAHIEGQG